MLPHSIHKSSNQCRKLDLLVIPSIQASPGHAVHKPSSSPSEKRPCPDEPDQSLAEYHPSRLCALPIRPIPLFPSSPALLDCSFDGQTGGLEYKEWRGDQRIRPDPGLAMSMRVGKVHEKVEPVIVNQTSEGEHATTFDQIGQIRRRFASRTSRDGMCWCSAPGCQRTGCARGRQGRCRGA